MKNLLVFLLLVAGVGIFFHDKQQTADLDKAQAENATLTQQLADKTEALNAAQAKVLQLAARVAQPPPMGSQSPFNSPGTNASQGAFGLHDSTLDQPVRH